MGNVTGWILSLHFAGAGARLNLSLLRHLLVCIPSCVLPRHWVWSVERSLFSFTCESPSPHCRCQCIASVRLVCCCATVKPPSFGSASPPHPLLKGLGQPGCISLRDLKTKATTVSNRHRESIKAWRHTERDANCHSRHVLPYTMEGVSVFQL